MNPKPLALAFSLITLVLVSAVPSSSLEPIPDKLVVLTFDDSVASQVTYVAPLLKKTGASARPSSLPRALSSPWTRSTT